MRSEVKQERTDWLWSRDRPHSPVYTSTLWFYFRPVVLLLSIVELEHAGGVETQKTCVHEKSHQGGFFYQMIDIVFCRKGWWELIRSDLSLTMECSTSFLYTSLLTISNYYPCGIFNRIADTNDGTHIILSTWSLSNHSPYMINR